VASTAGYTEAEARKLDKQLPQNVRSELKKKIDAAIKLDKEKKRCYGT